MILVQHGINLIFQVTDVELPEESEILAVNAYSKACAVANLTGKLALGDDSGVFIEALDYFPGVHSRRWAGTKEDDKLRNEKIIKYLKDENDRSAYLISRFSLVNPDGEEVFKTVVKNKFIVADEIDGNHGFGYDPILLPLRDNIDDAFVNGRLSPESFVKIKSEKNVTVAMLTQDEKNAINNRGKIAAEIKEFFDSKNVI